GGNPADVTAAHRVRAQAGAAAYVAARNAGSDLPALLPEVRASFKYLEQQKQLDLESYRYWAAVEQWGGAPAEAVNLWARALKQKPDDAALVAGLTDTAIAASQAATAVA